MTDLCRSLLNGNLFIVTITKLGTNFDPRVKESGHQSSKRAGGTKKRGPQPESNQRHRERVSFVKTPENTYRGMEGIASSMYRTENGASTSHGMLPLHYKGDSNEGEQTTKAENKKAESERAHALVRHSTE
jgi:hypothetical protein